MKDCRFVLRNVKNLNEEKNDIVIEQGKIVYIGKNYEGVSHQEFDAAGMYVSSGWIDLHVHAFPEFTPYGDEIDEIGVKQGVTTVVDAGSCGADRISELAEISKKSITNLFAFINISRIGLERVDELSNMEWIDRKKIKSALTMYRNLIVGLKARVSSSVVSENGIRPLRMAQSLSNSMNIPLMVHIGTAPPDIEEILPLIKKNDIITHFLNGKTNNLFNSKGYPLPVFKDAIERGVHLDVGHGTSSFSFEIAEIAKCRGIKFNTISTDIYRENRINGPVYSMSNVLTKFLHLGYSLEEVVNGVTINAARWLQRPELGRIEIGDKANLTLFSVEEGPVTLIDSLGKKRIGEKKIVARGVVVNDKFIKC